ncbi:hypothetical protein [Nitrobacter winogradskyi]|uniref:Uncharacterized protein n=2 Tax=Nitrobacter winogradskyi TaxID=913 RepID=A0ACC6ADV3_NITWI|nr:hypothetical protein [Nitrobacter winogradskyi]MCP1997884.1 hypothetical protein [Nitrobacter winogradskyi]GEC17176.1 hypothetical protein NWI01_30680 [Nitrobacter winogradskyi]
MRQMVSGMVAVAAMVAASVVPAMACGGWYAGGCASCLSYGSCAWGYGPGYYGAGYGFAGYEHLPSPTQYYYVNQGPAFSGPGNFAPVPTYQESAVAGWNAYSRPYYYPYDGGRYAHAMHHYYDGAPAAGPVVYSYRWNRNRHDGHPHSRRHLRYGHASRDGHRAALPRVIYGSGHHHDYRHAVQYHHD